MLTMNEIRKGRVIVLEDEPYVVVAAQFSRKQKSRPVMRATLRHLKTGKSQEHTFMQSDKVVEADLVRRQWQYLYSSGDKYSFMDKQSFEQIEVGEEVVGAASQLLLEGQEVEALLFAQEPVSIAMPIKIQRKVIAAPPGVRGDTSTNVMKDVTLEGGAIVKAPLFVSEGDTIVIDTRTGEYVERA